MFLKLFEPFEIIENHAINTPEKFIWHDDFVWLYIFNEDCVIKKMNDRLVLNLSMAQNKNNSTIFMNPKIFVYVDGTLIFNKHG